jgi:hypothetical protein
MSIGHGLKQFLLALQQNKLRKTRHAPTVENNGLSWCQLGDKEGDSNA